MLTHDSFLNNIPAGLAAKQRLELEALGFSFSSLGYSYVRLREEAAGLAAKGKNLMGYDPMPLFVNAWAVVDAAHLARQLVKALKPKSPELTAFLAETEQATLLRNKLHHISSNLANLAAQTGSPPPPFGALTFITTDQPHHFEVLDDGTRRLKGWRGYALHAGKPVRTMYRVSSDPTSVPAIESPIGMFELHAFGLTVNLSELQFSTVRSAAFFETTVASKVQEAARRAAIEHGVDPEEVLRNTGVAMIYQLETQLAE